MKNKTGKLILIFFIALSFLINSCDNPFFINEIELHKVTFSTNGGTEIESVRTDCIKETPYTSKTDNSFIAWHKKSDLSDSSVNFPLTVTEDITLYAEWQPHYAVKFVCNDGDAIEAYKTGIIETTPKTSRENHIFAGWYLTSDFSGEPVEFPFTVTQPTTFYAKWIATYQATFVTNGGTGISTYRTTTIQTAPETTKYGYSLVGWYTDLQCTNAVSFPYTLSADTIFYAKWQQMFTVSFVTNEGTSIPTISTGYIAATPVSTRTDYNLVGWYTDASFSESTRVTFPYTVTSDITLYAKWQIVQYTITYMPNEASSGTVPQSITVNKGTSYSISGNTGNLTKEGFAFIRWNTRADGDGQGYSVGNIITVTSNITLYAQWGVDYAALITVPAGSFYFGDPATTNRPRITLSSFQIAKYELTYELWLEVYTWAAEHGYNLTAANKGYAANDQYKSFVPATNISWNMACVWLNAYSEYKGYEPVYYRGAAVWKDDTNTNSTFSWNQTKNGYRLPTECEWEFAAGGGSSETHDNYAYAGSNTVGNVAWYYSNSKTETHPVGTKNSNTLSIYDMTGNIVEWCYDNYSDFGNGELTNPIHETGTYKCLRGGSLLKYDSMSKIFIRGYNYEIYDGIYGSHFSSRNTFARKEIGIRIARNVEE